MEVTASALQTVQPNSDVIYTNTAVSGSPCILHREDSGLVTLRGLTVNQPRARFRVTFGANVAIPTGGTVGPISLAISINGEPVTPSTMISTPAAVEEFNNIHRTIHIDVPAGCCTQVSVKNVTLDTPVAVENANFIVERVA